MTDDRITPCISHPPQVQIWTYDAMFHQSNANHN